MQDAAIAKLIQTLRDIWISSGMAAHLASQDARHIDAALTLTQRYLEDLDVLCDSLDLPMTKLHLKDTLNAVETARDDHRHVRVEAAEKACMILSNNLEKEMSLKLYFTLPHDKAEAYNRSDFGNIVSDAFPSSSFDVSEASRCYALGRNTACVYHLMRVMEIGLKVLAKQFNLPSDHTNWEQIINRTEKAIAEMDKDPKRTDTWKADREFYSQCASHFRVVKDGWRNYTAHARGKYDDQEALDMLGNVRGFMQKLATRLREP